MIRFGDLDLIFMVPAVEKLKILCKGGEGDGDWGVGVGGSSGFSEKNCY